MRTLLFFLLTILSTQALPVHNSAAILQSQRGIGDLARHLIYYYKFDAPGNQADLSTNSNTATASSTPADRSTTWGVLGPAQVVSGGHTWSIADSASISLGGTKAASWFGWIMISNNVDQWIFNKEVCCAASGRSYSMNWSASSKSLALTVDTMTPEFCNTPLTSTTTNLPLNEWIFYVAWWDPALKKCAIQIGLSSSPTNFNATNYSSAITGNATDDANNLIFAGVDSSNNRMYGLLGPQGMTDTILSEDQKRALRNVGPGGIQFGSAYPFTTLNNPAIPAAVLLTTNLQPMFPQENGALNTGESTTKTCVPLIYRRGPNDWLAYIETIGTNTHITCYSSTNGRNWTRRFIAYNPTLSWENDEASPGGIFTNAAGLYYMIYHGGNNTKPRQGGILTSTDLTNWTALAQNPVITTNNNGTQNFVANYGAWQTSTNVIIPYGENSNGVYHLAFATTTDGTNFTKQPAWTRLPQGYDGSQGAKWRNGVGVKWWSESYSTNGLNFLWTLNGYDFFAGPRKYAGTFSDITSAVNSPTYTGNGDTGGEYFNPDDGYWYVLSTGLNISGSYNNTQTRADALCAWRYEGP